MKIEEKILKESYVETYKKMLESPVYKIIKLDITQNIEELLVKDISANKDLSEFAIEGRLKIFKERYGHTFDENIKGKAVVGKTLKNQQCDDESKKIKVVDEHSDIYYYLYLRNRLRAIEEQLQKFNLKPIIEISNDVSFVALKQP